jgi:hypothetical protein
MGDSPIDQLFALSEQTARAIALHSKALDKMQEISGKQGIVLEAHTEALKSLSEQMAQLAGHMATLMNEKVAELTRGKREGGQFPSLVVDNDDHDG